MAGANVANPGMTVRKMLLYVRWDWQSKHLLLATPLQLNQKRPVLGNRRGIVFHQDNDRPQTSLVTRQKLREHSREVLTESRYNLDWK